MNESSRPPDYKPPALFEPNMALQTVGNEPTAESFTALSEHRSQTPTSFFEGKPVLHLHRPQSRLRVARDVLARQSVLTGLQDAEVSDAVGEGEIDIPNVDVWATSRHGHHATIHWC